MPDPEPLAGAYEGFVVDLDGVVYRGAARVPHAAESLGGLGAPVIYTTNNASRPPSAVAGQLAVLGLTVTADDIVTSAQAGAADLLGRVGPGASVLAVGGEGVSIALRDVGLVPVAAGPVRAVLQGFGTSVTAGDLAEVAYAVQGGAVWVATNTDLTIPTDRGVAPGNGSLVATVVAACGGRQPDAVVGKPHRPLYAMAAARCGVAVTRMLAIGDRLDTDVAGANANGLDSLFVLTGVDDLAGAVRADDNLAPTFVAADLRALKQPLARPRRTDTWWVCGADRRRWDGGAWDVAAEGSPAERLTNSLYALRAVGPLSDAELAAATRPRAANRE